MSLAFYGFLAFIAWRSDIRAVWRVAAIASACLFILLIGFLRLYLGVHYLSDVIAGYAFGAACLWLAIKMTTMLEWRS
jgi:undecaprenyl-diphosphatase